MEEIHNLCKELEQLYIDEGLYWRQWSKTTWMKEGDRNTHYFHTKATSRHRRSLITGLRNSAGQWQESPKEIEKIISDYFSSLFASSNPDPLEIDAVLESLIPSVRPEMDQHLSLPCTHLEVTRALSQMGPLKSPRPDGFPALFFQRYWHLLGSNISCCVLKFLNDGYLPPKLNYTFVVLIPKVPKPDRITDFRPISLCKLSTK